MTLPWWNWTMRHDEGLPAAYTVARDPDGDAQPAARLADPGLRPRAGRADADEPHARARTGAPPLPTLRAGQRDPAR